MNQPSSHSSRVSLSTKHGWDTLHTAQWSHHSWILALTALPPELALTAAATANARVAVLLPMLPSVAASITIFIPAAVLLPRPTLGCQSMAFPSDQFFTVVWRQNWALPGSEQWPVTGLVWGMHTGILLFTTDFIILSVFRLYPCLCNAIYMQESAIKNP